MSMNRIFTEMFVFVYGAYVVMFSSQHTTISRTESQPEVHALLGL